MSEPIFGWAQSGDVVVGNPNAVTLQADFTKGPKGQNYTIQFGLQKGAAADVIRPWADITWIVNGNQIRRRVSVTNGLSVTGQAEVASVRVYDSLRVGVDPFAVAGTSYGVTINVSPGARASVNQPPQWSPIDYIDPLSVVRPVLGIILLAPTTNIQFVIPENIGAISVQGLAVANVFPVPVFASDILLSQLAGASFIKQNVINDSLDTFLTLMPGANLIRIDNRGAATTYRIFLTFGVDG